MRRIAFYTTAAGRCPVQETLDQLPDKSVQKIAWVLRLVRDLEWVPASYMKKLAGTDDIWEIRADLAGDSFRLLGFLDGADLIVVTHCFAKKTQQTPRREIELAEQRRSDYLRRRHDDG
jgi:phage-related protein